MDNHRLKSKTTLATIAEKTERYDDMKCFMKEIVESTNGIINKDHRVLLTRAYKMAVEKRQKNIQCIQDFMAKTRFDSAESQMDAYMYQGQIKDEILKICNEVLSLIDKYLLPSCRTDEENIHYLSMQGDFRSYAMGVSDSTNDKERTIRHHYQQAYDQSRDSLSTSDPLRLDSAYHMAMFHYKVLWCPEKALVIATKALEEFGPLQSVTDANKEVIHSLVEMVELLTPEKEKWPVMVFH